MKKQLFVIGALIVTGLQAAQERSVGAQRVFFEDAAAAAAVVQTTHAHQAAATGVNFRELGAQANETNALGLVVQMANARLDNLARQGQPVQVLEFRGGNIEAYKQHRDELNAQGHAVTRDFSIPLTDAAASSEPSVATAAAQKAA